MTLTELYKIVGESEKAKTLANRQNSIYACKELLLSKAAVGEKIAKYETACINILLTELNRHMVDYITSSIPLFTSEYSRKVMISFASLCETIFDGGEWDISQLYLTAAEFESRYSDVNKALDYFDKGFDQYKNYMDAAGEEYTYTAPLLSGLTEPKEKMSTVIDDFWTLHMQLLPDSIKDEMRKNAK